MRARAEGILRRILESACAYPIDTAAGHRDGQWLAEQLAKLCIDQTEIDALTTPAKRRVLQRISRQAFKPYIDPTLSRRVAEAKSDWDTEAQEAVAQQIDAERLERTRIEASTKLAELREQIEQINAQLDLVAGEHFTLPPIEVPEPEVDSTLKGKPWFRSMMTE